VKFEVTSTVDGIQVKVHVLPVVIICMTTWEMELFEMQYK